MTQTLRRELKQKLLEAYRQSTAFAHADSNMAELGIDIEGRERIINDLLDAQADAALEVAGIAKKFRDPTWDLLHGKLPDEEGIRLAKLTETYTNIANRLSAGLRRGEFPQSIEAQKVYRWIAEREVEGQSLDRWIQWAMDGKRAEYGFVYHKDPTLIRRDWPQVAWPQIVTQPTKEGSGFYG